LLHFGADCARFVHVLGPERGKIAPVANNTEAWLKRAKEILQQGMNSFEAVSFAPSILAALYGPRSPQLEAFNSRMAEISRMKDGQDFHRRQHAISVIKTVIGEIENDLIVNLRAQIAGEVLSELVGLGKEILADNTDSAKNVSAVLIAAAFEDLIRRMGAELAGVSGRPKLEDVITALKNAGVLKGGEVGTAQSYLKFRNDSLHADWAKVDKPQIQSCTAFVEALLMKHFS
jgi:hypothetical protein